MSNYKVQNTSGSAFSNVVALTSSIGLVMGLAASSPYVPATPKLEPMNAISYERNSSSYGQYTDPYARDFKLFDGGGFELAVATFYSQLVTNQEPLGAEFEKVLYDNLDSLLIRI